MAYTPPPSHAVPFVFTGVYTPPASHAVPFVFGVTPPPPPPGSAALPTALRLAREVEDDDVSQVRRRFAPVVAHAVIIPFARRRLDLDGIDDDVAWEWRRPRHFEPPVVTVFIDLMVSIIW